MARCLPPPVASAAGPWHARALFVASVAAAVLAAIVLATASGPARAQSGGREEGPRWSALAPSQREALRPLQRDWASIDANAKQQWMDIAARMPGMAPYDRALMQARMAEWARLSPEERSRARLAYQETKQVPLRDRQSRWEAYQALSEEERRQLQRRAVPPPVGQPAPRVLRRDDDNPLLKSNIVPNPAYAVPRRPVAPAVVEAGPGVSTDLMSRRPAPPPHQQTGMPKITATPGFVDRSTLLPQRGPQGAATRPRDEGASRGRDRD